MPTKPYQSVLDAIYTKFKSDQTAGSMYALVGGRLVMGVAYEDVAKPFILMELRGGSEHNMFGRNGELVSVTFTAITVADDVADVIAILDATRALFDHASLTFSGYGSYSTVDIRPGSVSGPQWVEELLVGSMPYTIQIEES